MSNDNKLNMLYFEDSSMRGLYESMDNWQNENRKRLLSTSIHKDGDKFCCIALINPTEVIIVCGDGELASKEATVSHQKLWTTGGDKNHKNNVMCNF